MNSKQAMLALTALATFGCGAMEAPDASVANEVSASALADDAHAPTVDGPVEPDDSVPALPEVATFAAAGLDATTAKNLALALKDVDGVLSAKPILEKDQIEVTFQPPSTNSDAIRQALATVVADITLVDVKPGDPHAIPGHDCGSCPKKSCPHAK